MSTLYDLKTNLINSNCIIRIDEYGEHVLESTAHNKPLHKYKLYDLVIEFLETKQFYVSYHNKKQISKIIIDELGKKLMIQKLKI
jgi:hypothetical protein